MEAHFVDNTNTLLIVFCPDATIYVDLSNGNKQYSTYPIAGVDYASDQANSIFTCEANQLTQVEIVTDLVELLRHLKLNSFYKKTVLISRYLL